MLESVVRNSDDAILSKRLDGTILGWNKGAERIFGYRQKEMVGQSIFRIIPPDRVREEKQILRRLSQGQHIDHYETRRRHKSGRIIDVSISVSPIRNRAGKIIGAFKIARDITEQKRAEANLRNSEQLMRAIVNTAADAILTIDEDGLIQSANLATERLFGYQTDELIGRNVRVLMPEPFHGEHDSYLRRYLRTGRAKIIGIGREVTGLRKDGVMFPIHLAVGEVNLGGRRLFTGIIHDLRERHRLERQIIEASSNEQRRIGQDLHDGLCQDLIGIAFSIDAAGRALPPNMGGVAGHLAKIAASVRAAAGQARDLSHGLNPVDVRAGGLSVALENLSVKVTESFGVDCTFEWDQEAHAPDDTSATHLYRIAQEAISNAIKHGKARKIEIGFYLRGADQVLSITDNGKGLPQSAKDRIRQGFTVSGRDSASRTIVGIGLQTMQYRARVIGGTFAALSEKRGGTVVTCTLRRASCRANSGSTTNKPSGKTARRKPATA
ncbi:MAG TPA: PAS domain S-box protein [Tepidisphaeraceae bacterium]|nr:PAS domain S-box protein [Tepidisphaeraceae bacterium]